MAEQSLERMVEKRTQTQGIISDLGLTAWIMFVADNHAEDVISR